MKSSITVVTFLGTLMTLISVNRANEILRLSSRVTTGTFPEYRYTPWHLLDEETRNSAQTILEYNETTWNMPGTNPWEWVQWDRLPSAQREGAKAIGFEDMVEGNVWDCYHVHFKYDLAELAVFGWYKYYEKLGWTKESWVGDVAEPESEGKDWAELAPVEKDAAEALCYIRETWDQVNLLQWNSDNSIETLSETPEDEIGYPNYRYTPWHLLDDDTRKVASSSLGYDETTWNIPFTNSVEHYRWDRLSPDQQRGAHTIGFVESDGKVWDCYQSHYSGYSWKELEDDNLERPFTVLGWTEESWEGDAPEPDSDTVQWDELTLLEQDAAEALCYFKQSWNQYNILIWIDDTT